PRRPRLLRSGASRRFGTDPTAVGPAASPSARRLNASVCPWRRSSSVGDSTLQHHGDIEGRRAPAHLECHLVTDVHRADGYDELIGGGHGATLELEDDVSGLEARLVGRAAGHDRLIGSLVLTDDADTLALVPLVEDDPDDGVLGLAGADELLDGLGDLVARDREADPDVAGRTRQR